MEEKKQEQEEAAADDAEMPVVQREVQNEMNEKNQAGREEMN